MGTTEPLVQDTPSTRLTDFLARYPSTKYLRLVHTTYGGQQQTKSIPIHHARLVASHNTTLRPGDEVPPSAGAVRAVGQDERGVMPGSPNHVPDVLLITDDTGAFNWNAVVEGELSIQIDWTTLSPILAEPKYAFVNVSLYHVAAYGALGYGYDLDPRMVLRRMLKWAKDEHHMEFTTGAELEFTLFDEKDTSRPLQEPRTSLFANQHGTRGLTILEEVVDTLEAADIHVWSFHPESGVMGQFELQLFPSDPATTADWVTFGQHVVRNVATRHACFATFAAAPVSPGGGTGRHIHLSLSKPAEQTTMHFIAGLLQHTPALSMILGASIDGYSDRGWQVPFALWANNKFGPIHFKHPGRLELRAADAHFAVHLQLSAIIAAGLDGVKRQLTPKQTESPPFKELVKFIFEKPETVAKMDLAKQFGLDIAMPKDLGEAMEKFKEERGFWDERLGESVVDAMLSVQEFKWKKRLDMTKEDRRVKLVQTF